ncbi:Imm3 family immunity protein [Paenibacillus sp. MER 99-2]|uniref:Imm3 family immunity protein n=1 Tax=Paenibacillus sp. MER 99-2 TaxID=2939572 RepID=UPI00203A581C|nr:Imm3 family immunity protein [Paenibacillus sp. MER 99-2]MCM3172050.1 Imm3 family immunity protein [Paenibacillus sp. MER 99-2]
MYYYEIEKEVKSFFGQMRNSTENVNLLIEEVFDRFERECKNTKSEDIVVKTTLLELLSKHGMNTNESLVIIRSELEKFNINDVGQQLSEDEKLDLSTRIKEVLNKV